MLPFSYTLKNLWRDPARTFQLILGAMAVVLLILVAGAFNEGMERLLQTTGSEENILLIAAGAIESLERSSLNAEAETLASATKGVVQEGGRPAVSTEVHYMSPLKVGGKEVRGYLRGITPQALLVHTSVRLKEGRLPKSGEVMVGTFTHKALGLSAGDLALGATLFLGQTPLKVVGLFEAPQTRYESEIWGDKNDLLALSRRESPSCVIARTQGGDTKGLEAIPFLRSDLEVAALSEKQYYEGLSAFFQPIVKITWISALLVAAGAIFGGFNTLYAAFGSRSRELASLQAIGFSRRALLASMLMEASLACLLGTLLACLVGVFCLEGLTISLSAGTLSFMMSPTLLTTALLVGISLGLLGAFLPAWNCLRQPLPVALRSI